MAQNYYSVEKAAEVLGVSAEEVNQMREQHELNGYRDGASWKFKADEVDHLAKQRSGTDSADDSGFFDESLLTIDPGHFDESLLNDPKAAADTEADSIAHDDFKLETLSERTAAGDSALNLSPVKAHEEDVLGGSGSHSDVSVGGDSGIFLVDPSDSGLALEQLASGSGISAGGSGIDESLENAGEASEDFLLTPTADSAEDDGGSSSQVIALDIEDPAEVAALAGSSATASMVAMLGENAKAGISPLMGTGMAGIYPDNDQVATIPGLPEEPYSVLDMVLLSACIVLLCLCGIMAYDLVRNIWSWDSGTTVSGGLVNLFVK